MLNQEAQEALVRLLGESRFQTYLDESGNDETLACELYMWATQLAGAFHSQLSFVEIAVRNSLDSRIKAWNQKHGCPEEWTGDKNLAEPLYSLIGREVREARKRIQRGNKAKTPPKHDDVIAQLTFGTWVKVIYVNGGDNTKQENLWKEGLHEAFPNLRNGDSRQDIGNKLDSLRRLRNRIAHHENLLKVKIPGRINQIYSVLTAIDPDYQNLVHSQSTLRELNSKDPRRRT